MRRYESVLILDPQLSDEDVQNFTDRYSGLIKEGGGEIIRVQDWGQRRLAYLVKKRDTGRYLLLDYVGMPAVLNEVERQFKISEQVLKFISVMLDDNVDLDAFKEQAPAEKPASTQPTPAAAETAPPAAEPEAQPAQAEAAPETAAEAPVEPAAEAQTEAPVEAEAEVPVEAPAETPAEPDPAPQATEPAGSETAQDEPKAEASDEPVSDEAKKEGSN